jgi:hypothetical protein
MQAAELRLVQSNDPCDREQYPDESDDSDDEIVLDGATQLVVPPHMRRMRINTMPACDESVQVAQDIWMQRCVG